MPEPWPDGPALRLPSCGPDPLSFATALTAVTGYARGRRPLRFRSPDTPEGRWVRLPAFGWARYDARPADAPGDDDVLVAEALHGRLDRDAWGAVDDALARARPLARDTAQRARGRALWELPDGEFSVLDEPGTVGALLREIGRLDERFAGHVLAALHHRRPHLVPHLTRSTRRAMLPFLEEGDSGVEAVVHRELRANADAFAALEAAVATRTGIAVTRLRLHDVLLWLTTTLRLPTAVEMGREEGTLRIGPGVWPVVRYDDLLGAMRFLCDVLGFENDVTTVDGDDVIVAEQLRWSDGTGVIVAGAHELAREVAGVPGASATHLVSPDVDAVHRRALAAGAEIVRPPEGSPERAVTLRDPEGNVWTVATQRGFF